MRALSGRGVVLLAATVAALAAAPAAHGHPPIVPVGPWDGTNPFDCTLQQAGFGTEFEDPGADPFCVEYDKRRQNVIPELGIVDFLLKEPARVAAALPKCFYFQHDHWRAALIQDDTTTEIYNWDGSYFFDRATGRGGVYVENFRIAGRTSDPRTLPGFPSGWEPFFGPGRGGIQLVTSVRADPACGAPARAARGEKAGGLAGLVRSATRALAGLLTRAR